MPRIRGFLIWLLVFYSVWLGIVYFGDYWLTLREHWEIAAAMLLGSYVAGSTPMGGGTVAFPVLTLLFDLPGSLGRNFGLAIQSVGMVSASIFILTSRRTIDWRLLRPTLLGAIVGTPVGAAFIAPFIPDLFVKITFAVIWASFGIMHLVKLRELTSAHRANESWHHIDTMIGWGVGVSGGVVASITGVGIDMILYATMVLLYRADLKVAIPTSILIMAFASVVGISTNLLLSFFFQNRYAMDVAVFNYWLAAAPVVALGAPLGALVVNLIPRAPTLIFVSLLCIGQFVWTLIHEQVIGWTLAVAILGVLLMNVVFHLLYQRGASLHKTEVL